MKRWLKRQYRRAGRRLIERMIAHFRWHNTVLNTTIANTGLRCTSITVVNVYGQERVARFDEDGVRLKDKDGHQ